MPKMKTRKSISKKVKLTASGKLMRRQCGKRHLATNKSSKRKRKLGKPALVDGIQLKLYKRLIGAA